MSKKELLPEMNLGLIGHVDHGKTTLALALTGKWTAAHSEELKRGITIKLGYADMNIYKCPKCKSPNQYYTSKECPKCKSKGTLQRVISFVDAPGHETLMAIMVSGAAIMDGALLVIAANELAPQPQTKEHLMALKVLGIKNIVVVQNKVDLVTKADAKKNYEQIKSFVKDTLGFDVPIVPVSSQKKVNIGYVVEAIQDLMPTPKRETKETPEMLVARSFDTNKPGTLIDNLVGGVIGGAIIKGVFKVGQEIEIRPGVKTESKNQVAWTPVKTKIASIVTGQTFVKEKGPGGSVAISTTLDPAVTKGDAFVGNVVGLPGKLPEVRHSLELEVELFDQVVGIKGDVKIEPIKMQEPLVISVGTSTTLGLAQQIGKTLRLALKRPVAVAKGHKVALSRRIGNRWHLVGYGVVQ